MRTHKTQYTLLGSFVLLAFGGLISALYVLGGDRGPTTTYYTELQNVSGIKFGTAVTYAGYPLGQVEAITPRQTEGGTRYLIELRIRQDWRIPDDSRARVVADGLLTAVSIDIEEGESRTFLPPQGRLPGISSSSVFTAINAVAGEFQTLSRNSLRPLLSRLQSSVDVLAEALESTAPKLLANLVLVSDHMSEGIPDSIEQLHALSTRLNQQVPDILDDLQVASATLRRSTPLVADAVRRGVSQFDHLMSEEIPDSIGQLHALSTRLNQRVPAMLDDLQFVSATLRNSAPQLADAVQRGVSQFDKVLSDKNVGHVRSILHNLDRASADANLLVERMDSAASSVNSLIADVDSLIESSSPQFTAALSDMRISLQSVRETVETLGHHLEGSSRNMHEFSRRIRENPSVLLLSTAPQEVSRQ